MDPRESVLVRQLVVAAMVVLLPAVAEAGGDSSIDAAGIWHCPPPEHPKADLSKRLPPDPSPLPSAGPNAEKVPPEVPPPDVSPPDSGYSSDDWVTRGQTDWQTERARREAELQNYLCNDDPVAGAAYGFDHIRRNGHRGEPVYEQATPRLAWEYFGNHPIGYGGVPYVLLQTLLSIDPLAEDDPTLQAVGRIWRQPSRIADEQPAGQGKQKEAPFTLDHLGIGPHPLDYDENWIAKPPEERTRLPNGLTYDPEVVPEDVGIAASLMGLFRPEWRSGAPDNKVLDALISLIRRIELATARFWIRFYKWWEMGGIAAAKIRETAHDQLHHPKYDLDVATFQQPPAVDPVFFACTTCHQGRVVVDGELGPNGEVTSHGRMHFMPGMPNTEIEAQYYSKLLMKTGFALLESGFSEDHIGLPASPTELKPDIKAIEALEKKMLERVLDPDTLKTIYPGDSSRAILQTYWVARDFPKYIADLIGVAVKTQYIYRQIAGANAYAADPEGKIEKPDLFGSRPGQMDAFGVAAGLIDIHTKREENSYLRFICRDNWENPLFAAAGADPGPDCDPVQLEAAGNTIREQREIWVPPVPAPIDIPSLTWSSQRKLANWDGNQGAGARTLASGTSATGDPLKVNVRIHQPLNSMIDSLPPAPYPFEIDREKAARGKAQFEARCSGCHAAKNSSEIFKPEHLRWTPGPGNEPNPDLVDVEALVDVDMNRAIVTTSELARFGMASLVMEACAIFVANTGDENTWCMPKDEDGNLYITHDPDGNVIWKGWWKSMNDYFEDTPARVRKGTAGYKVEMQHGIWARAPYLHNGSVPTLGHLLCPQTRPPVFKRGVVFYDQDLVGFEWKLEPQSRYSEHETQWVVDYDTRVLSHGNGGHGFGSELCPNEELNKLDPEAPDYREDMTRLITGSPAGDLIEYMKTF